MRNGLRLPPLPTIAELIRLYRLSARKALSQNFILDLNVTDKLVRAAGVGPATGHVLEIGPGVGSLTRSLLRSGARRVTAIEKDPRFLPALHMLADAAGGALRVVHGDALTVDLAAVTAHASAPDEPTVVVGNLPFGVATPFLLRMLRMVHEGAGPFRTPRQASMTLTFQREVADRIVARPGAAIRSRLSLMAQCLCDVESVMRIPATVFEPRPKVSAGVVRFTPRAPPNAHFKALEDVARVLFRGKRKRVRNNVRGVLPDSVDGGVDRFLNDLGISPAQRPASITDEQFRRLVTVMQAWESVDARPRGRRRRA